MRRRIGSGAFATVWLAHDDHLDSLVAIKVLADNWTDDLHVRQRFIEEGRFLRKVESPHVVAVYDAGVLEDERPYLVMAYADQGTLADRLEVSGLSSAQALTVITQVGRGLEALHDRGVLHRDVKPGNVLFRTVENGRGSHVVAMLGDLGLGKAMDMSSRLTMVGGTPAYVAPEQALGEPLDPRADQFSLAALSYYLLAGRQPFDHRSLAAAEDPAPPPSMGIDNPAADAVVLRGLAKDRDDRFEDVAAFTAALVEALGGDAGEEPRAWIPVDPDLATEVRAASTAAGSTAGSAYGSTAGDSSAGRRGGGRRWPWVAAAVLTLAAGTGAGWAAERASTSEREVEDATGTIAVTVPESWTAQVDPEPWTPAGGRAQQPSIASGTREGWNSEDDPAPGVFVGILPGEKLPSRLPSHPECGPSRGPIFDERDGDDYMTTFSYDCQGLEVTVERVVRLNQNQLLWIQIRSDELGTANRVLDSVTTYGV
ncbi:serine/threonine protein kinase [Nocardioides flavus (ex Wang et al. 2016)]|uniref:non-specific serine/threonine protein kinase n=1 Tax=Nocardioides flavus (ex Wang et al. 2016) TaxID=2058780 RepID=A0ABQ3HFM9_9ACTN|nr:serine/threonine protein kinase [Nocardioides flavus (ex Wang et al. 2016)]